MCTKAESGCPGQKLQNKHVGNIETLGAFQSPLFVQCPGKQLAETCLLSVTVLKEPGTPAPLTSRVRWLRGIPWVAAAKTGAPDMCKNASEVSGRVHSQLLDVCLIRSLPSGCSHKLTGLFHRETKLLLGSYFAVP